MIVVEESEVGDDTEKDEKNGCVVGFQGSRHLCRRIAWNVGVDDSCN